MKEKRKKKAVLFTVFTIFFVVDFAFLTVPALIRMFDRNDIWVGIMPLSQFYILFFTGLAALGMAVLYHLDLRIEKGGDKK